MSLTYTAKDLARYRAEGCDGFPNYSSIGGYTVIYVDPESNVFCGDCATKVIESGEIKEVACDTYDEGPSMFCDECGREIESSYGDPDAPESEG